MATYSNPFLRRMLELDAPEPSGPWTGGADPNAISKGQAAASQPPAERGVTGYTDAEITARRAANMDQFAAGPGMTGDTVPNQLGISQMSAMSTQAPDAEGETPEAGVSTTPGAQPDARQRRQQGGGWTMTGGLDPNYRYTNQDFYSSPQFPMQYNTGIAGDPIWTAAAARVPMGLIANRMAQVQEKQSKLNEWINSRYKQFEDKAAPIYEVKYQNYVTQEFDDFFKDVADTYYGGNINKAYKGVYTNPQLRAQYESKVRNLQGIGVANKTLVGNAFKIMEGVTKNEMYVSKETEDAAKKVLSGALNFDRSMPLAERADKVEDFRWNLSFDEYWQGSVLKDGRLKQAIKSVSIEPSIVTVGGERLLKQGSEEATKKVKEEIKKEMRAYYRVMEGDALSKRIDEYVDANIGQAFEEKYTQIKKSSSKSRGSGDVQKSTLRTSLVQMAIVEKSTNDKSFDRTLSITPYASGKTLEKLDVNPAVGSAASIRLMAPSLVWFPGSKKFFIVGQSVNDLIQTEIDEITGGDTGFLDRKPDNLNETEYQERVQQVRTLTQKLKQEKKVPVEFNAAAMRQYWGSSDPYEVVAKQTNGTYSAEQVKSMIDTRNGREKIAKASDVYIDEGAGATRPAASFSGGLPPGATRPAATQYTDQQLEAAVKKYGKGTIEQLKEKSPETIANFMSRYGK